MKPEVALPLLRLIGLPILTLLGPYRWRNRNFVPKSGGVLLLANHTSDIDPVLVQGAIRRHITFMAKQELFEMGLLGRFIRWYGAFPVRRGEPDRAAIRYAVEQLRQGKVVCVFPEGQLSEDGKLQPILPGVTLIARMAHCPVVCVGIRNAMGIMPFGKTVPRPALSWVTVSIGQAWEGVDESFVARVRDELLQLSGARPES